jgi:hypothetical protein
MPEVETNLRRFQGAFRIDFLTHTNSKTGPVTVWIYEKMDLVAFFNEEKLISHFKWTRFKKKFRRGDPPQGLDPVVACVR